MQIAIFAALFLSFVSSSLAYLVRIPNDNQGWKSTGPQTIAWDRVVTDAKGFAVVLTNQDRTVLPRDMLLEKWVDGTRLVTKVWPPHGGFPTGKHFRVNLIKSAGEQHTIYAQSNEFSIRR